MIAVDEITTLRSVEQCRQRWNTLTRTLGFSAPYFSFEWYHTALETVDRDSNPLLLFFKVSGEDIGFAPLVYREERLLGLSHNRVGFVDNPHTPYQGLVYARDFEAIVERLVAHLGGKFGSRFYLDWNEVRATEDEWSVLARLAQGGRLRLRKELKPGSRYIALGESFQDTLAGVKKRTQKEFRRKMHRLGRLGQVGLSRVSGEKEVRRHLDSFFEFYARTWKEPESNPEFYHRLCGEFDAQEKLYFYCLALDDRPIAYLICFAGGEALYGIKITYDPSYYAFSPGVMLVYEAIEDMYDIPGIREFDIGRGDEQFKREWTSTAHEHSRLLIYPQALYWRFVNGLRYSALPRLKQQAWFRRLYTALKSRAARPDDNVTSVDTMPTPTAYERFAPDGLAPEVPPSPWTARYAGADDLDRLTVLMAATSLKDVQSRLETSRCVLIVEGAHILGYAWLPDPVADSGRGTGPAAELVIDHWGLNRSYDAGQYGEMFRTSLLRFIISKGLCTEAVLLAATG